MAAKLVLDPEYAEDEEPTRPINKKPPALSSAEEFALRKLVRNWTASSPEARRLIQAVAVHVRTGVLGE